MTGVERIRSRENDVELVRGFIRGERKAYSTVDGWITKVVRHPRWSLGTDTADIAQDVRLILFENLQSNKFQFRSSLKTYVSRVAKYTCIDHLRCRKHLLSIEEKEIELEDTGKDPSEALNEKEQKALFLDIFQSLPQHCRDLWRMIWEEKLPYQKVAERLKISEGTVKTRVFRCKEKAIELGRKISGNPQWIRSTV
jgi:RNA polymerase sigma-70 factor (ECF subfamily)